MVCKSCQRGAVRLWLFSRWFISSSHFLLKSLLKAAGLSFLKTFLQITCVSFAIQPPLSTITAYADTLVRYVEKIQYKVCWMDIAGF